MIKEQNGIKVEYPDAPAFAFSPMSIKVDGWSGMIVMRFSCGDYSAEEMRYSYNEHTEFNPMKYAQESFDLSKAFTLDGEVMEDNGLMKRADVTLVFPEGEISEEISIYMFVVYGAHDYIDGLYYPLQWPKEYYSNLPCSVPWTNLVQEIVTINGVEYKREDKAYYNILTDGYSGTMEIDGHELKDNSCTDGVYLRWIDRHGFPRYKLFKEGVTKAKYTTGSSIKREQDSIVYSLSVYKTRETEISCCAPLVERDELKMLGSLLCSPVVQMYRNYGWLPVMIADTTIEDNGNELQDFEITVKYITNNYVTL